MEAAGADRSVPSLRVMSTADRPQEFPMPSRRTMYTRATSSPRAQPSTRWSGKQYNTLPLEPTHINTSRGITRDQEKYPDPDTFNPNRWLDPTFPTYRAPLTQHPSLSGFSQFGFGRRVCQGIPIVEQDLFLAFSGLAWAFDVRKARDTAGHEIPVHWNDFTPLLIAKPKKFRFDLVPRSDERRAMLKTRYARVVDAAEEGRVRRMEAEIGTRYEDVAGAEGVMMQGGKEKVEGTAETTVVVPGGEVDCESESDHDVLINMGTPSSEGDEEGTEDEKLLLSKLADAVREVPGAWA